MKNIAFLTIVASMLISSCSAFSAQNPSTKVVHPDWSKNAVIYELNTRQFTPEGTFKAAQKHLPRLKELGVDIIWFMPISKIGEKDRKGELGSYYSIQDYTSINPEFGNLNDFKAFVDEAHKLGLKVIIDWVANHTSRDSKWLNEHPEWFAKDSKGNILAPFDWTDVAKLDYSNPQLRVAMVDAMKYWLKNANIDGFRCDVAGEVPTDFWDHAVAELKKTKHVLMLAEAEKPELLTSAFDMDYAWNLHSLMNQIAQGKANVTDLDKYYKKSSQQNSPQSYRMVFTSNHDENSWNGTEFERMKDAAKTFAVFTYITPSMPLIYNGQEVGMNKRLEFFKKDSISWSTNPSFTPFYQQLNKLKKGNPALWNGNFGGSLQYTIGDNTITIVRKKGKNVVTAIFNLSKEPASATVPTAGKEYFTSKTYKAGEKVELKPWQYLVFTK